MECHSDPMQTLSSANSAVVDGTVSRIPVEYEVEGCPKLALAQGSYSVKVIIMYD
jgi:hypothetical protein